MRALGTSHPVVFQINGRGSRHCIPTIYINVRLLLLVLRLLPDFFLNISHTACKICLELSTTNGRVHQGKSLHVQHRSVLYLALELSTTNRRLHPGKSLHVWHRSVLYLALELSTTNRRLHPGKSLHVWHRSVLY